MLTCSEKEILVLAISAGNSRHSSTLSLEKLVKLVMKYLRQKLGRRVLILFYNHNKNTITHQITCQHKSNKTQNNIFLNQFSMTKKSPSSSALIFLTPSLANVSSTSSNIPLNVSYTKYITVIQEQEIYFSS